MRLKNLSFQKNIKHLSFQLWEKQNIICTYNRTWNEDGEFGLLVKIVNLDKVLKNFDFKNEILNYELISEEVSKISNKKLGLIHVSNDLRELTEFDFPLHKNGLSVNNLSYFDFRYEDNINKYIKNDLNENNIILFESWTIYDVCIIVRPYYNKVWIEIIQDSNIEDKKLFDIITAMRSIYKR
jgi:hypothetical protein